MPTTLLWQVPNIVRDGYITERTHGDSEHVDRFPLAKSFYDTMFVRFLLFRGLGYTNSAELHMSANEALLAKLNRQFDFNIHGDAVAKFP